MRVKSMEMDTAPVNLCGAVTIAEVRSLLKEWIQSSPGKLLLEAKMFFHACM